MAVLLNNTPFTISHLQPFIAISNEVLLKQRHKPMTLTMLKIGHLVGPKLSDLCSHYFELMNAFSFSSSSLELYVCEKSLHYSYHNTCRCGLFSHAGWRKNRKKVSINFQLFHLPFESWHWLFWIPNTPRHPSVTVLSIYFVRIQ